MTTNIAQESSGNGSENGKVEHHNRVSVGHQNGEHNTSCTAVSQNGYNHTTSNGIENNDSYDVFLSHSWGKDKSNHKKVSEVNSLLKELGYKTWFDEDDDRMKGHTDIAMSSGIEGSQVMLVFITEDYVKKASGNGKNGKQDNCFKEFNHGVNQLGPDRMLPVIMESGETTWTGLVGLHMNSRIYVNLSGNLQETEYVIKKRNELKKRIDEMMSATPGVGNFTTSKPLQVLATTTACKRMDSLSIDCTDSPILVMADSGDVCGQIVLPGNETIPARTHVDLLPSNPECRIGAIIESYETMKNLSDELDRNQDWEGFGKILLEKISTLKASNDYDPDIEPELKITKLDIENFRLEMYGGGSPAGVLLDALETRFPDVNIQSLHSCAKDLKRMDICNLIDGWNKTSFELDNLAYKEKKDLVSHIHKIPDSWKGFAGLLGFSLPEIDKMARSAMLREKDSPTKKLFECVYHNYPNLKVAHLCDVAKELGRTDVITILQKAAGNVWSGI